MRPGDELDPNPFCATEPYQLRVWDATAAAGLQHCPRYHYLSNIRGLRVGLKAPEQQTPVDLRFGSLIHEGKDIYAKALAAGADPENATELALEHVLEASWGWGEYREVWQCPDRTRTMKATKTRPEQRRCPWSKAEHLLEQLPDTGRYICQCGREVEHRIAYIPEDKTKNRHTACRSIVALCDALTASNIRPSIQPDGRVGSEYRWLHELPIQSPDGTPYLATGSFDGLSTDGDDTLLEELKTTRREPNDNFFAGLSHTFQLGFYLWAGGKEKPDDPPECMLMVLHCGVGFTEVYFKPVRHSSAQRAETEYEASFWIKFAEDLARNARLLEEQGKEPQLAYPRNRTACSSMPGASTTPCPFRKLCGIDPRSREAFIQGNCRVERWNPLGTKGTIVEDVSDAIDA